MNKLIIHAEKCKACGLCIRACPKGVLALGDHMNAGGYKYAVVVNQEACIACGFCAMNCPDMIISIYKED